MSNLQFENNERKNIFARNEIKTLTAIVSIISLLILMTFEMTAAFVIYLRGGETFTLFYYDAPEIAQTCDHNALDPVLGYNLNACNEFGLKNYKGLFYHGSPPMSSDLLIVTVGGSTTEEISYQTIPAIGAGTWPKHLYDLCSVDRDCTVVNLAVSGYTSSQELFRLIRDGLPLKPDIVVALNGINEVHFYHEDSALKYPMVSRYQQYTYRLMVGAHGVAQGFGAENAVLPNLRYLARVISFKLNPVDESKFSPSDHRLSFGLANSGGNFISPPHVWLNGASYMNALVNLSGGKFIDILQPTMGVGRWVPVGDHDRRIVTEIPQDNNENMNDFYREARPLCVEAPYCYDATDIYEGIQEELYYDPRHTNTYGNSILAEFIWERVKENMTEQ